MEREFAVRIRSARSSDFPLIARLSDQLGYPTSPGAAERRLESLLQDDHHAAFVVESSGGEGIGWVHVFGTHRLEADPFAEIGGLIVEESCRGKGAGRSLLQAAEDWARERGYPVVRVRSNVIRENTHRFYRKMGYRTLKTQKVYGKNLG